MPTYQVHMFFLFLVSVPRGGLAAGLVCMVHVISLKSLHDHYSLAVVEEVLLHNLRKSNVSLACLARSLFKGAL